ncbi:MAG: AI-2E family transporter [Verrucomicrobiae bacterium]|nr:AI-2E family transporter [Verrucomicrobiae bacterium]
MKAKGALYFLLGLLAASGVLFYRILEPFIDPLVTAAVLAVALLPLHRALTRFLRGRTMAAAVSTLLGVALIVIPLGFLAYTLSGEVSGLYKDMKAKSAVEGGWGPLFEKIVEPPLDAVSGRLPISKENLRKEIVQRVGEVSGWMVAKTSAALGGITATTINMALAVVILFFFLRDGEALIRHVTGLLPLTLKQSDRLVLAVAQTIVANVHGVLAVAAVQGTLLFLGFWMFGVGSPLLWAMMGAFLSMIPLVGAAAVWVPVCLTMLLTGSLGKGVGLAAWCMLIVANSDNIVRPLVVGSRVRQHPMLVFFAMIGGIRAFGILGLLLGPIILAITISTIDLLREEVGLKPTEDPRGGGGDSTAATDGMRVAAEPAPAAADPSLAPPTG